MNKVMALLGMGLVMSASVAGAQQTTVTTPLNVTVSNVCTYNPPDMTNVNGLNFPQQPINLTYNALADTNSSTENYIFRCTKGTSFTPAAPTVSGLPLTVNATNTDVKTTPGSNVGDVHTGTLALNIPAGQFDTASGTYNGTVTQVINYN